MSQLQPDIMIIDGANQNWHYACIIGAEGIGIDLVAHQRSVGRQHTIFLQTLPDSLGKWLLGVGDAVNAVLVTENLDTVIVTIGHHANPDLRSIHSLQPRGHLLRRHIGRIRDNGVVKIHHQQFDLMLLQKFRRQISKFISNQFWK